jgi:hypothetical protein
MVIVTCRTLELEKPLKSEAGDGHGKFESTHAESHNKCTVLCNKCGLPFEITHCYIIYIYIYLLTVLFVTVII